jgi:hypothetical protein
MPGHPVGMLKLADMLFGMFLGAPRLAASSPTEAWKPIEPGENDLEVTKTCGGASGAPDSRRPIVFRDVGMSASA